MSVGLALGSSSRCWLLALALVSAGCDFHDGVPGDDPPGSPCNSCDGGAVPGRAQVGVFHGPSHYFELDTGDQALRFHFGDGQLGWSLAPVAIAGDFDGDGLDTIGLYDRTSATFHLADVNDSDELEPSGRHIIIDAPSPPPPRSRIPIAGRWIGDVDSVGVMFNDTNTFHLLLPDGTLSSFVLSPADGYPLGGIALAGNWDGEGSDGVGIFDPLTRRVHLRNEPSAGPADVEYSLDRPGAAIVAGDFDGDGVDTLATFDATTSTFHLSNQHTPGAETAQVFGHLDPSHLPWTPLAGAWQVPSAARASQGYDWPTGSPQSERIDADALESALVAAGVDIADIHSVLVARNGTLVGERYYHGYDRHMANCIKSVTKSLLSGIYGVAVTQGRLPGLGARPATYLPGYFDDEEPWKSTITIEDLLTMRAGFEWYQWDADPGMNGMIRSPDWVGYQVSQDAMGQPGVTYLYSGGVTHLASAVLTQALGMPVREFAREQLLAPLGISITRWDHDPAGTSIGSAEVWMRPRDMLRFGQLYLDGGVVDGRRLIAPGWVELSVNPWIPTGGGHNYGLLWRERVFSHYRNGPGEPVNDDMFFAWGSGGQFIFAFPRWQLLIAVTSRWDVNHVRSEDNAQRVFDLVNDHILPAVTP